MAEPLMGIVAPVVASVWQIHVEVGEAVTDGQAVATLESMKMEIPIYAPCDGTVAELPAALGQIVQEGDTVVVIAPA